MPVYIRYCCACVQCYEEVGSSNLFFLSKRNIGVEENERALVLSERVLEYPLYKRGNADWGPNTMLWLSQTWGIGDQWGWGREQPLSVYTYFHVYSWFICGLQPPKDHWKTQLIYIMFHKGSKIILMNEVAMKAILWLAVTTWGTIKNHCFKGLLFEKKKYLFYLCVCVFMWI